MEHKMGRDEILIVVKFMSGYDALPTQDGSYPFSGANLEGADLRSANLYGADLRCANLRCANLYGANLRCANLRCANLYGANLYGADLRSADLRCANLYGAELEGAELECAELEGADLRSANLYGANLRSAELEGADLRSANLYGADFTATKIVSIYLPGMSGRGDSLKAYCVDTDGKVASTGEIVFRAGCFSGSGSELRAEVIKEKGDTLSARLYLSSIDLAIMALKGE